MFLSLIVHNSEVEEPGDVYNHHFESLKDIHVNINKERGGGQREGGIIMFEDFTSLKWVLDLF